MYLGKNEWVLNFPYQNSPVYKANKKSYLLKDQLSLENSNSAKREMCLRLTKCSEPHSHTQSALERGVVLAVCLSLFPDLFSVTPDFQLPNPSVSFPLRNFFHL